MRRLEATCIGLCCLLAIGCVKRVRESSDWEADAKVAAARALACPAQDLSVQTIDRSFVDVDGYFVAKGITVEVRGCDRVGIFVWTPADGWVGYEGDLSTVQQDPAPSGEDGKVKRVHKLDGWQTKP